MRTRSELDVDSESTLVVEKDDDGPPCAMLLSGDEIFVSARTDRRGFLPVSLRRGRRAKHLRLALARANHPCQTGPRMYLVDVDGEAETMRIDLRRRFEDISDADAMLDTLESVAG